MQNATYGTYVDGCVILDEPVPVIERAEVIVVFLDKPRRTDRGLLDAFGTWKDLRHSEEIVADIRASRVNPTRDGL